MADFVIICLFFHWSCLQEKRIGGVHGLRLIKDSYFVFLFFIKNCQLAWSQIHKGLKEMSLFPWAVKTKQWWWWWRWSWQQWRWLRWKWWWRWWLWLWLSEGRSLPVASILRLTSHRGRRLQHTLWWLGFKSTKKYINTNDSEHKYKHIIETFITNMCENL